MAVEYLSPRAYADYWRVHYHTVYSWIHANLLKGVIRQQLADSVRYHIPKNAFPPRLFPGPKPKRREEAMTANMK